MKVSLGYIPCALPRFDTFLDVLTGSWNIHHHDKICSKVKVEEVMRSCGGAVQGIREPIIRDFSGDTTTDCEQEQEGVYHNRADDEFVYFDCGSYSSGNSGMTSLMIASGGDNVSKVRALISLKDGGKDTDIADVEVSLMLLGRSSTQKDDAILPAVSHSSSENTDNNNDFIIHSTVRCRMPSPTQNWMIQRVKWESTSNQNEDGVEILPFYPLGAKVKWFSPLNGVNNDDVQCWMAHFDALSDEIALSGATTMVQVGVKCVRTGEVKAMLRGFDSDGHLKCVELQSGVVKKT